MNHRDVEEFDQFQKAIEANPYDASLRLVFADWLEEKGEDDTATWHRTWTPERQKAEEWMKEFADKCGSTCVNYAHRNPDETYEEEVWRKITYGDVVEAGREYINSLGRDMFVQQGDENARNLMDDATTELYWNNFQLLTGIDPKPVLDDKKYYARQPFSCSC